MQSVSIYQYQRTIDKTNICDEDHATWFLPPRERYNQDCTSITTIQKMCLPPEYHYGVN